MRLADINFAYYSACFGARFGHLKQSSRSGATSILRAFFRWSREKGLMSHDPLEVTVGETYSPELPLPTPPEPTWKTASIPHRDRKPHPPANGEFKTTELVGVALIAYLEAIRAEGTSEEIIHNAATVLGRMLPMDAILAEVTPATLDDRFAVLCWNGLPYTRQVYWSVLHGFFTWCHARGWIGQVPINEPTEGSQAPQDAEANRAPDEAPRVVEGTMTVHEAIEAFAGALKVVAAEKDLISRSCEFLRGMFINEATRLKDLTPATFYGSFEARFGQLTPPVQKAIHRAYAQFFAWCRDVQLMTHDPLDEIGVEPARTVELPPPFTGKIATARVRVPRAKTSSPRETSKRVLIVFPRFGRKAPERNVPLGGAMAFEVVTRGLHKAEGLAQPHREADSPVSPKKRAATTIPARRASRTKQPKTSRPGQAKAGSSFSSHARAPNRPPVEVLGGLKETLGMMTREDIERVIDEFKHPREALFFRLYVETNVPVFDLLQLQTKDLAADRSEATLHSHRNYRVVFEGKTLRLLETTLAARTGAEGYVFHSTRSGNPSYGERWALQAWRTAWAMARIIYKFETYTRFEELRRAYQQPVAVEA